MGPCHTKEAKSLTHEVTVSHDKYKPVRGTFVTEEGNCDKEQKVTFKLESKSLFAFWNKALLAA